MKIDNFFAELKCLQGCDFLRGCWLAAGAKFRQIQQQDLALESAPSISEALRLVGRRAKRSQMPIRVAARVLNQASANRNRPFQGPQGISKISTCFAMPRSERFSGVAAMPFDCNSFEASLSVTTRLVAKMERDVASPWTRAAIFTVRPK